MATKRPATSLVEVIVIVGIIILLFAMLLPAIQRVKAISLRLESMVNLKALMQGMHQYSIGRAGKLPGISLDNLGVMDVKRFPLYVILPYLDVGFHEPWGQLGDRGMEYPQVKYFLSPSDPSVADSTIPMVPFQENTSYCTNTQVFDGLNRLGTISDGLSYTIGIAERYRGCFNNGDSPCIFVARGVYPITTQGTKFRTSTFADKGYGDVYPITLNGVSQPSIPGTMFQMMPSVKDANGSILQATQREGLITIMMDGSIRTFPQHVKSEVFWGAMTPAGNEVISFE